MSIEHEHYTTTVQLPPPADLLRAFVGQEHADSWPHAVLTAAAHLADAHRRRELATATQRAEIDAERDTYIARINAWVAAHVAHRTGASLHTESLGAVIDRLAAKWVAAQGALRTEQNETAPRQWADRTHLLWCRLAELTDGYRDLVTDVTEHRRRLPVW
ncbi:DUF4254 domain-containing protein [Nocardia camponoti]|uniref:DUF4254 domain-containing protein n=1 Tax=Nocardia camponoti TaxID=1616106 RepID=A0A917QS64_9NOCA|nr:DUF4254 domain-containing protein [Nocardia camponoti]GGK64676.1 hypothetical protein GCM10011591_41150 [Nocardia camponoti]